MPRKKAVHGLDPNEPHGPDITNLHTHGLHVSPKDPADNVFLELGPGDAPHDFIFKIDEHHPCGTFWYHAHKHGSVAFQLASGMAGALIVEGDMDNVKEIHEAEDRLFVIQQINYHTPPVSGRSTITPEDIYGRAVCSTIRA